MTLRYGASAALALGVTFGLFYLMQALITKAAGELNEAGGSLVEFVRLKKATELELKKRQMPKKEKPDEPPPPWNSHPLLRSYSSVVAFHAARGDRAKSLEYAYAWMALAVEQGHEIPTTVLALDPDLAPLLEDPEFAAALEAANQN